MNPVRLFDFRAFAIAATLFVPTSSSAQDVVMRRPVPVTRAATTAAWSTTPWVIYDGQTAVDVSRACGNYIERREVSCKSPGGTVVDEYFCAGTPKPAASQPARHDEGCTYSWNTEAWVDPGAACTLAEEQTRKVSCLRDTDKVQMPESMCQGAKPDSKQTVQDFSTCTYAWDAGSWKDPGASCTNTERQTRDVSCLRDLDKASVDASNCKPGDRPTSTQDVRDVSGCTYSWKTDPFVDPGSSCTRSETQTRTVTCRRSLNEELVDDASCTSAKPGSTQVVEDYSSCGFTAVQPTDWTPSSTCSATATKTRTFKCQRSNDGGEIVPDALCTAAGVSLTETVPEPNYSTCSHSWRYSDFADPGASCTASEMQARTATCRRDLDDALVDDAKCDVGKREPLTRSVSDYAGCQPYWYPASGWGEWSSQCSASATRNREIGCFRRETQCVEGSAGYWAKIGGPNNECFRKVGASDCSSYPTAGREGYTPAANGSETQAVYAGCSYSWTEPSFIDPGANCGNETWTRTSQCVRDLDKSVQSTSMCDSGKTPAQTDVRYDTSSCTYSYGPFGAYGSWASQCSASTTRTASRTCYRSDGPAVDSSLCIAAGKGQPTQTETNSNYAGCSNSWAYSGYVDPGASCTANETHTRTSWCKRDLDGAILPDSACSGQTQQGLTTNAGADYSGCGYTAVNWTAYTPNNTCSATATKTRTAQCRRGDGTIVAGSECTSRNVAVSETVTEANYSTCSNSWRQSGYVDPGANCGAETWTQTVTCKRDLDNALMPDASCTGTRPSATDPHTDYSSCTFSPHDHGYGACDGTNRPHYWDCKRSDGTDGFPASQCGKSNPEYENCYSYQPSATQSACTNGSQTVTNSCRRSDGQYVATSFCGQPASYSQSCTSYSWVQGGFGGFGACQGDSRQYQYQDVYCQSNSGGNLGRVDDSLCGGGKPSTVNSQGCTYASWQQSGWGAYSTSCGPASRTMGYQCIRASDGAGLSDAECSNRYGAKPTVTDNTYNTYGCGYTPGYGDYGACQPDNRSYAGIASCTRSDGAAVDVSECTNRGSAGQVSQACTYYSYSGSYGTWGACQANSQQTRTNSCVRRPDNASVDPQTYCGIPATETQGCTRTCAAGWGPERIIYSEDSARGTTADKAVAGQCTSGQGGTSASSNGNVQECWTRDTPNYTLYGRYCGNVAY